MSHRSFRVHVLCGLAALVSACAGSPALPGSTLATAARAKQAAAPLRAESADDLRDALLAASAGVPALERLIDPALGVGSYDPADSGAVHHCSREEYTTHPGMAFSVRSEDRFACDRALRRCTAASRDGRGYAFYFRTADGVTTLDTIVHYGPRSK